VVHYAVALKDPKFWTVSMVKCDDDHSAFRIAA
jgi:hypothetical protein